MAQYQKLVTVVSKNVGTPQKELELDPKKGVTTAGKKRKKKYQHSNSPHCPTSNKTFQTSGIVWFVREGYSG